jgi:microcystin-dependent protein
VTKEAFPFDAGAGATVTEDRWRKMAKHWRAAGVLIGELNELEVVGDASGMNVKVKSGRAWVEGHFFESDAQETLVIAAAHASNPRIDRVVLRADFTANTVDFGVVTGTPAVSPVAPPLTNSATIWEIPLAQVTVDAAAVTITASKVADERPFSSADGVPASATMMWPGDTAPKGWLLARGQEVSRSVYSRLFDAIGTKFGVGNGSSTFNLPNMQKRFPIGLDPGTASIDAVGETGGQFDATINPAPATSGGPSSTTSADQGGDAGQPIGPVASSTHTHDTDLPALNVPNPPYMVWNFIIKY